MRTFPSFGPRSKRLRAFCAKRKQSVESMALLPKLDPIGRSFLRLATPTGHEVVFARAAVAMVVEKAARRFFVDRTEVMWGLSLRDLARFVFDPLSIEAPDAKALDSLYRPTTDAYFIADAELAMCPRAIFAVDAVGSATYDPSAPPDEEGHYALRLSLRGIERTVEVYTTLPPLETLRKILEPRGVLEAEPERRLDDVGDFDWGQPSAEASSPCNE